MFTRRKFSRGLGRWSVGARGGRRAAASFIFLFALASTSPAQEEPKPERIPPNLSYGNEWRETRDRLDWKLRDLKEFSDWYSQYKDFTRSDLVAATNDYAPVLAAWEKALAAFRKGSVEEARALRKEAELVKTGIDWKERFNFRKAQAESWMEEEWARQIENQGGRLAQKFGPQFVQAKRRASMAWGRAADAVVPGADRQKIIELSDLAHAADSEAKLMESLFRSNQSKDGVLWDAKIASPELTKAIEAITALENEGVALQKDLIEVERRRRNLDRRHKQAEKDLAKAYADAVKAREAAKKQPR